jgi:serine/threonine-protein kinase
LIQLAENTVVADRFRLVRMIGRGGMGSVWEAIHIGLDTPCALKFIEGELINVTEAHARFEREAKVSAQLRSPHIVQIIDNGVWQGRPYIAMELLDGVDLGKLMAQQDGTLSPPMVNMIIGQVCRGLTKAHGAGVIHRDLKPDNIFIVNDDDRQLIKILDFGVAKSTGQLIENSNTKTGAMLGTPYYMSPEQAQGIKSVDARSDLWSIAVIAYQCLTGKLPFESEALGDLLVKIIVQPIPLPSSVGPVPSGFDAWWAKATDRNPDNRFQTAKELAAQLEMALNVTGMGTPVSADPMMRTALLGAQSNPVSTPKPQAARTPAPALNPANPATFSGMEAGLPKKGAPAWLFGAFAALAVIGIGAGVIAVKKTGATTASNGTPSATSTLAATLTTTRKQPDIPLPTPTETATQATPEPSTEPSAKPAAATVVAPTRTAVAHAPAPKPAPAPTGSAKKKWDPGF